LQGIARQSDRTAREVDSNANKMGGAFKRVGVALVAAGVADVIFQFGKASAQAAIDAQEMESAFNVVFGNMADDVRAWSVATGDALGRSTQEIQRGALAFQELFGQALAPEQAAALSQQFAVLTQDLASFKNLSNEVAQQKLFSGLVGEAEPLRAVGVFLNETAVQAKAAELGLSGVNGVLTDQEKIVARAALIQEQLANAQGDVERTSGSTANQIKTMNAAVEELQVAIGQKLLPALTPLITLTAQVITHMANAAQAMNGAGESAANMTRGLEVVFGAVNRGINALSGFASFLGLTSARLDQIGNAARIAASPVNALLAGIQAIGGASNAADRAASNRNAVGLGSSLPSLSSILPATLTTAAPKTITNIGAISTGVGGIGKAIGSTASIARAANDDFGDLFESIFPDSITRRQAEQLAMIDRYQAKLEALGVSRSTARNSILGLGDATVSSDLLNEGPLNVESQRRLEEFVDATIEARRKTEQATGAIAESFAQLADRTLQSLDRLVGAIRGGGFLDILSGVLNLGTQLASTGLFGSSAQNFVNRPVSGARANGGLASAGRSYLVGERGPELFTPGSTGFVTPRGSNGGGMPIVINNSALADVYVDGRIVQQSPAIMQGGAELAQSNLSRRQTRRVPG
jgi:hypothetical protein